MRETGQKYKNWRINIALAGLFLLCGIIVWRLACVQIIKGEHYRAWAEGFQSYNKEAAAQRGEIFFNDGEPLAINKQYYFAFASPPNIKDAATTADLTSKILKLERKEIEKNLKKDALYVPLKGRLEENEINLLEEAELEGIYLEERIERYYPQGNLASQVLGFVDENRQGQYGLEEEYDETLSGGEDLVLNLDYNIQLKAEELLKQGIERLNAQKGEIIVAEPATGRVLAMAKVPNFDPNNYKEYARKNEISLFKNDSCLELFEPGSVFKPITMASAINEGKITPETKYYDSGIIQIGGSTIFNYDQRSYGEQTMTGVLERSINTGAVFAKNQIGNETFLQYLERFGFFEPTGIDIAETYSENREFKKGYEINYATASFGQGIEITSVQLVRAFCALANGGFLPKLEIVNNSQNQLLDRENPINKETSEKITKMLSSVVENGFGKKAKVAGYFVSGKTGTAQMSWSVYGISRRGYSDKTMQSFIGWLPSYDPKFLVLVKINAPETNTAEYSAIPIFHDLAEHLVYLYQIPPDEDPLHYNKENPEQKSDDTNVPSNQPASNNLNG